MTKVTWSLILSQNAVTSLVTNLSRPLVTDLVVTDMVTHFVTTFVINPVTDLVISLRSLIGYKRAEQNQFLLTKIRHNTW